MSYTDTEQIHHGRIANLEDRNTHLNKNGNNTSGLHEKGNIILMISCDVFEAIDFGMIALRILESTSWNF